MAGKADEVDRDEGLGQEEDQKPLQCQLYEQPEEGLEGGLQIFRIRRRIPLLH